MIPNSLITAASFTPNLLQSPSAWLGHLPFAAWVIQEVSPNIFVELGTHYGHSYFSFCQSIVEAGLSTKCFAVDTWQGDEHAGRYNDEIFAKVYAHHQEHYVGFSRLMQMTFNDAVTYFADESIDLLHIDGLHTYEAVRHDFETWLPKLAPGAVVMFHDTNVRERDFGVWKLWEELQARYPNNLEFVHSHGLGVLQLNNVTDDKKLGWLQLGFPEKQRLINYFTALGIRQLERFELNELEQHAANLSQAVAERDRQIADLNQTAASLNQDVAERDGQIAALYSSRSWKLTKPLRWCAGMARRLYVYCFWRNHGSGALYRLVLFKLKLGRAHAAAVPGETVARHEAANQGNARDLVGARFEACSPLRVFSTPGVTGMKRISIVTDSINTGSLYGGVGTAIIIAALLAEAAQARLRIITRTERAQPGNLEHVLSTYGIRVAEDVEFVFAPSYDRRYEIDFLDGERFITTSWWTTAATMASVPHASITYLLQEDERMFYPYGDDHLRCSTVLRSKGIRFVINTKLLFDHLLNEGFSNIADNGMWFEPAFPAEIFYPRSEGRHGKRTLMFYARPNNARNLFYFGIDLLERAVARGIIDLGHWDILLIGKDVPKVVIGESYVPEIRENLAWAEYAKLIGDVDLGLCLMYTPHPSYPPLDLAASGAVVVTNKFANKIDLSAYSKNIVCSDLDRESMIEALAEGVHLASDDVTRRANHREGGLRRSWRTSTSGIVQNLSEAG